MRILSVIVILMSALVSCQTKTQSAEESLTQAPQQPTQRATPVLGIDVSHFQGDVNWEEIKAAGITYVYDKATQGETYKDPDYQQNKRGAHQNNLFHGSYHFYMVNDDPIKQAQFFLSQIDHKEGDLAPALDLEQGGVSGNVDKAKLAKDVLQFLDQVESAIGIKPIIYTNHPFGNEYLSDPKFSKYPLWIAEYEVSEPKIPSAWQENGWLFWQRSEKGKVEGVVDDVDRDILHPEKSLPLKK